MVVPDNKIINSIIKTLCYSDLFEYPLKKSEIVKFYIGRKTPQSSIYKTCDQMIDNGLISKKGNYYFLNGKGKNVNKRKQNLKISKLKWEIARNTSNLLSKIPSVKLVGVSGSLSVDNASKKDDVDLFFITSSNTLWITRFLVNITLFLNGLKRGRTDSFGIDLICPNMFISENDLKLEKGLFIAHEITQLKVLLNKHRTYEKFLYENRWVTSYLPHVYPSLSPTPRRKVRLRLLRSLNSLVMTIVDRLFFSAQYLYMKKRITAEKIDRNRAFFHPKDKKNFVEILWRERVKLYKNYLNLKESAQPQNSQNLASNYTPGY